MTLYQYKHQYPNTFNYLTLQSSLNILSIFQTLSHFQLKNYFNFITMSQDTHQDKKSSRTKKIQEELSDLTKKLRGKHHQYPKPFMNSNTSDITKPTQKQTSKEELQEQSGDKSQEYYIPVKQKITWNHSAQAWTRQNSPSHSIPKAKRFSDPKPFFQAGVYPELYVNLRSKVSGQGRGVSFAKSLRPKLFTIQPNPSPDYYDPRRYLQNSIFTSQMSRSKYNSKFGNSRSNPQGQLAQAFYHIKGGTMNRFGNHELLYYPHTKKLNYNDKIITEELESKQIRMNPKENSANFRIKKNNNSFNM